jgi:hypothetical protein
VFDDDLLFLTERPDPPVDPLEIVTVDEEYDAIRFSDAMTHKMAEEKGLTILIADDNMLQLDIDEYDLTFCKRQIAMAIDLWPGLLGIPQYRRSKSGINWHVIIPLNCPLPLLERILLQACLGSDIKREMLCYAGHLKGHEHPVVLFRPKEG